MNKEDIEVEQITSENWNVVSEKPIAVVEFSSQWCAPCKRQKEVLKEISQKMNDIFMAQVDIEESSALTDKLGVRSVPTTILLQKGQEKKRFVGSCSRETIEKELALVTA